jgi:hypothetical protein
VLPNDLERDDIIRGLPNADGTAIMKTAAAAAARVNLEENIHRKLQLLS